MELLELLKYMHKSDIYLNGTSGTPNNNHMRHLSKWRFEYPDSQLYYSQPWKAMREKERSYLSNLPILYLRVTFSLFKNI